MKFLGSRAAAQQQTSGGLRLVFLIMLWQTLAHKDVYARAGIKKLRENGSTFEQLEEDADSDIKVASDIPNSVADDAVSQVLWMMNTVSQAAT